ncbi:MAG: 3-deoxy-manno-octulosonate cytidylyltransferase, partial [Candidatus Amulumruptor sp.]|nr:3-deoxy-manno-octulosonate cytidylyltransferase [Candidatus Amulumruptor sp.]
YRPAVLAEIVNMPQSPLEISESLEQLRWLQAGYRIATAETTYDNIGIDTPADLEAAIAKLSAI